jgi:hypothetical protein
MVFLEQELVRQSFWMKHTLIPLSVAFWDEGNTILAILDMEPCRTHPCSTYDPGGGVDGGRGGQPGVLRPAGVEVGDEVRLDRGDRFTPQATRRQEFVGWAASSRDRSARGAQPRKDDADQSPGGRLGG